MMRSLRADVDRLSSSARPLIISVDGSYANQTVLRQLPERTTLIARVRKDMKLHHLPQAQPERGRKRLYGEQAPTPHQLLTDPDVPWQSVRVFASGREHSCKVKELQPVLWSKAGSERPLRLIVIGPLSYRPAANRKLLYRSPAYLICTDLSLPLEELVQAYFARWDIEVNHRDEKQLIGVGEAQVRSPKSVDRFPSFAVAMYSLLLVAHAQCHGFDAKDQLISNPKWRQGSSSPRFRVPTGEILTEMRSNATSDALKAQPNFGHFDEHVARHMKCPKSSISLQHAIDYATQ